MVPEKGSPDPDNGARKMVTDNATDNARGGSPTTPRHRQWFLGGVFPEFPGRLKNVLFFLIMDPFCVLWMLCFLGNF